MTDLSGPTFVYGY